MPEGTKENMESTKELPDYDLKKFRLTRILNNNTKSKTISLLGKFPDLSQENDAVVLLEKKAFLESDVQTYNYNSISPSRKSEQELQENNEKEQSTFFCNDLDVRCMFVNNIYGSFDCIPPQELNGVKITVVYPATEKHIEKYSICQRFVINETQILYENITLPYLKSSQFSIEWVYNILDHKQEVDRIVYEDADKNNGFILLPDMKWDGKNLETLYLLALVHKHNIKSLRDLTSEHLPLLRNLRAGIEKAMESRYGLLMSQLRIYFHYQPSFYHLHLHINPVRSDPPGIYCEKSHMLETVINNLELVPNYYQRATIPFVLYEGSKLLELYQEEMVVSKRIKYDTVDDFGDVKETNKILDLTKDNDDDAKVKIVIEK